MIKSMTGYGRAQQKIEDKTYLVEIKSVNHRYFDFSCRMPRSYSFAEEKVKGFIHNRVSRGKVDLFVTVTSDETSDVVIKLNRPLLENYLQVLRTIRDNYGVQDDISAMHLSKLPDVCVIEKREEDQEAILRSLEQVVGLALDDFIKMRENEGRNLYADLTMRGGILEDLVSQVEKEAPLVEQEYEKKLAQRMEEILGNADYDRQRLLTEVAIFADKVSITEEIVRLKSHIKEYYKLLQEEAPVGRKLDFLIQEMNRESNTIGSKCNFVSITKHVVDLKSELEKIREQIQNIE